MPTFSIILATRDRPVLFRDALNSVIAQTQTDTEIIVVNDGSAAEHHEAYEQALAAATTAIGNLRIRPFQLVRRPHGHGQSYALNYGVAQARGDFLCFLDDDDRWIDTEHLQRASEILQEADARGAPIDLYMTNQLAFRRGRQLPGPIWLEALAAQCRSRGHSPCARGTYSVTVPELMAAGGFCHINCLVVPRALYEDVAGMDEGIRWECDRDLFLRVADRARRIVHHPQVVSRHEVPEPGRTLSMTTQLPMLEKRRYQLQVLDKAALFARHPAIRAHGRQHKGHTLKKITEELARSGRWKSAVFYAREALGIAPTFKWTLFTSYCQVRQWARAGE
ncbi:glycosyltransferase [uncultured Thiodictyon sp.]|jgi:glycosyltransferase involved in cell wall biosynthesis|uniref:glycosyltransferase family 2 protein n=1 Tax=uncultured Thiodictyon sp. TaxID=1846217 RepID=UPI0025DBA88B|nr:glycosyltransferase [uncultured Thiodictyon sp.]